MQLHDIKSLEEESYVGNIGVMEMFKFFKIATPEQKNKMKQLLSAGKQNEAWKFLQLVTGVKLK